MTRVDVRSLDALPAGRACSGCGGPLRFSHTAYAGRGESVAVHVCRNCGRAYRGGVRDTGTAAASRHQGRTRPLPAEGGPDNPVIDETTARLLRERFGEEEPGPDG